jgi:class 3 adenylate cyclase/predicted ATPase
MRCSRCGFESRGAAKFCAECGSSLAVPAPAGERRQLTVMFCDLAGSTELSARLDPEELRDLLREYQASCAEAVHRFDGSIAQYLGDGILVYFGVPQAHEDDARRAAHAGLAIVRAIEALNARLADRVGARLAVRVGIHTGPVVVGDIADGEGADHLAIGETPNLAARLQSAAVPGTVVASETTHRLIATFLECRDLGSRSFAGVSRPIRVYAVVRESEAASRGGVIRRVAAPAVVGRQAEMAALAGAWDAARAGRRPVVLLRGEAGIGKSRLVEALKARAAADAALVLEGHASPYYQHSPFHAVTHLLGRWLGLGSAEAPHERRRQLEDGVGGLAMGDPAAVPLIAALLSIPIEDAPPLPPAAAVVRRRTIDLLLELPRALAAARPVALIIEDLHWADPSTLEWLGRWVQQTGDAGVLTLLTCRPEFDAAWRRHAAVSILDLAALEADQAEALVARVAGGKPLPAEVVRQIVDRSDGVPLFIEETTQAILESGALADAGDRYELRGELTAGMVPMSLRDALMARLDRLGTAKSVVQLGAAMGRDFSWELLQAVADRDEASLRAELARAVSSGLLQEHGPVASATFAFKHSLVQETAYDSLLRRTRQSHHRRIAAVLETRFSAAVEQRPELAAHHHTEAGDLSRALPCWQGAGSRAIARAAFAEAIGHLTRGVRLVESLPEGPERDRQELALQSPLGIALQAHRGYANDEVDRAYARARALCQTLGDVTELVSVLRGQHMFHGVRADYGTAMAISREMLGIAERDGHDGHRLEAHLALGLYSIYLGEFAQARDHFERGIALYDPGESAFAAFQYLGHSAAMCHSYLGRALSFMGAYERARQLSERGLELARAMAIPMSQAQAMGMYTNLHQTRREIRPGLEWAARTRAYATEHGFPYWSSLSSMIEGWLIGHDGDADRGIAQVRQGLDRYVATGARLGLSWFLVMLAELYALSGRWDEGFDALERASAHAAATSERYYEAEIHRLQGVLWLKRDGAAASEAADEQFQRALAVAQAQAAHSWSLRAATSLARLRRDQGRAAEGRDVLAGVYGAFTEGLDLPDLREAREVLEEMG